MRLVACTIKLFICPLSVLNRSRYEENKVRCSWFGPRPCLGPS